MELWRKELLALGLIVITMLFFLYPSLRHARREYRDGIRRDEIAVYKRELEQYFNTHDKYPVSFDAPPHQYIVTEAGLDGATAWYLRARLENRSASQSGFDKEAGRNYYYRIINDGDDAFYDVCGGTFTCGAVAETP